MSGQHPKNKNKKTKTVKVKVKINPVRPKGPKKPKKAKKKFVERRSPNVSVPRVMSAVNDGVNVGMVWKNSNTVRDFFKPRFEKVCDLVTAGTAFAIVKQFYLNPGNNLLFPVFSKIASTYEEYVCHRLRFWYRGEEYMASGSTLTAGIIAYATNMDPDDSTFSNIDQMENYEASVSGPPFAGHFCHDVSVAHKTRGRNRSKGNDLSLNQYFVFSSNNVAAPVTGQSKFYDMGNFQVASNGTQAASPVGELWVEHSWTMIRRKQSTPLGQDIVSAFYDAAGTIDATRQMGTTQTASASNTLSLTFASTLTFTIPTAGRYIVAYNATGTTLVATASFAASTGTTLVRSAPAGVNTGSTRLTCWAFVDVTSSITGGIVSLPTFTLATFTAAYLSVTQIPSGISVSAIASQLSDPLESRLSRIEYLLRQSQISHVDSDFDEVKENENNNREPDLTASTILRVSEALGLGTRSSSRK